MDILEETSDEHFLDTDECPIMLDVVIVLPLQRHSLPSFFSPTCESLGASSHAMAEPIPKYRH
jgi:hypothetical protein